MFFIREIKYLYYYEKSKKSCSAGTCKCQVRDEKIVLDVCLKKLPMFYPLQVKMYFTSGIKNQMIQQECDLLQEKKDYRFVFSYPVQEIDCEKLYFFLQISSDKVICDEKTLFEYVTKIDTAGQNKKHRNQEKEQTGGQIEKRVGKRIEKVTEKAIKKATEKPTEKKTAWEPHMEEPEVQAASKQSLVHIPDIHGQKEKYYVLDPEQLKRFGQAFSQYEDNSFLLHGYYNYRHILVGPVLEKPVGAMRIGVPGNYYKREEVVAEMFGFLDFVPAKGETKTGSFGYYYTTYLPLEKKQFMDGETI